MTPNNIYYGGQTYKVTGSAFAATDSTGALIYRAPALDGDGNPGHLVYLPYDNHAEIVEQDEICDWTRPDHFDPA
jgi:hypothetical protein